MTYVKQVKELGLDEKRKKWVEGRMEHYNFSTVAVLYVHRERSAGFKLQEGRCSLDFKGAMRIMNH